MKHERQLPLNWPKGKQLPSIEEAEEAVRKIEENMRDADEVRKKKLPMYDNEMFQIVVGPGGPYIPGSQLDLDH